MSHFTTPSLFSCFFVLCFIHSINAATLTLSKDENDSPTHTTIRQAIADAGDGDHIVFLDSGEYMEEISFTIDKELHIRAMPGTMPVIVPVFSFDADSRAVFQTVDGAGGSVIGDRNGGRILIRIREDMVERSITILAPDQLDEEVVRFENLIIAVNAPGEEGVLGSYFTGNRYTNQPASALDPVPSTEYYNINAQLNGRIGTGFRRWNSGNFHFKRVDIIDPIRHAVDTQYDEDDPALESRIVFEECELSSPESTVEINNHDDLSQSDWTFEGCLLKVTGENLGNAAVIWNDGIDTSVTLDHCALLYLGEDFVTGLNDGMQVIENPWAGYKITNTDILVTGNAILHPRQVPPQDPSLLLENCNVVSKKRDTLVWHDTDYSNVSLSYNNINAQSSDEDAYVFISPGPNDIIPGQDPQYPLDLKFGNLVYENEFLYDKASDGGPIGAFHMLPFDPPNDSSSFVREWNLYR